MNQLFATPVLPSVLPRLHLGQAVHVNVRAAWLPATVRAIAAGRVAVIFETDLPTLLSGEFAPWTVRPADGLQLRPVKQLRAGEKVVAYDGTPHPVGAAWPRRDGYWTIPFADGRVGTVPAGAILRVTDPTPRVTVNGCPV